MTPKGFIAELAPLQAQSAWGSREKRVRAAGLAACCNYLKKKKNKSNDIVNGKC